MESLENCSMRKYRMSWRFHVLRLFQKTRSWFELPSDPLQDEFQTGKSNNFPFENFWTFFLFGNSSKLRMEKQWFSGPEFGRLVGWDFPEFLGNFGRIQPTKAPLMLIELSFQNNELHKNRSWDGPTLQLDCLRLGSKFPWLGRSRHKLKMPDNTCCFNCKICVRVCTPKTPLVFWIQTCAHFLGSLGESWFETYTCESLLRFTYFSAPWNVDQSMTSIRDFSRGRPSWFGKEIPRNNAFK